MESTKPPFSSSHKPKLSFWQIWNMCFGFLGIQFGWGLQMGNMSAIYSYLGAEPEQIPILWLAAPLTGLIVQPIIGQLSDTTWNKFGRRKPYFFLGAVFSSVALVFMPMSSQLWIAAGLLWILDTSVNVSMEPFRALVADNLPPKQRTSGFAMQSFFIGFGAILASILPYVLHVVWQIDDIEDSHPIPLSVRLSFYIGAIVYLGAVLFSVWKTKEYPPEDMAKFEKDKKKNRNFSKQMGEVLKGILSMPKVMRQLAWVQFFTWMGLFFMWLYFVIAIPITCFGNPPVGSQDYIKATQWGSVCFGFYSLVTLLFSFKLLPKIAAYLSPKFTHVLCLLAGGIGLISVWFIHDPYLLFLPMIGVGIAWASILSIPYAILANHIPNEKMGLYMGIFNFFIVLPEIASTLFFGFILSRFLNNNVVIAVVLAGVLLIFSALLMFRVDGKIPYLSIDKSRG